MAVEINVTYEGSLRCEATHAPSGNSFLTDAPVDNQGKGESFSPTDLVATGLATCVLTTIALVAGRRGVDLGKMSARVLKEMHPDPPRRIGKLLLTVTMPPGIPEEDRKVYDRTAHTCPVHRSLHPDIEAPIEFVYPD